MTMRNRIKDLLRERKWSAEYLAAKIHAHPTTISRLVNSRILLGESWLVKLSEAFDVPPEQILAAPVGVRLVEVRGVLERGAFAPSWQKDSGGFRVPIPDDRDLERFTLEAAETKGPSANKRYPEGTVVVFNVFTEASEPVRDGARYVVERRRPDGYVEASVRQLWRDPAGKLWLISETDDPRHQEALPVDAIERDGTVATNGHGGEGVTARLVGRVLYAVHREV
jgi:transcriptional regulator with XRE-family HTH domain